MSDHTTDPEEIDHLSADTVYVLTAHRKNKEMAVELLSLRNSFKETESAQRETAAAMKSIVADIRQLLIRVPAAVITPNQFTNLTTENEQTKTANKNLTDQNAQLQGEINDLKRTAKDSTWNYTERRKKYNDEFGEFLAKGWNHHPLQMMVAALLFLLSAYFAIFN